MTYGIENNEMKRKNLLFTFTFPILRCLFKTIYQMKKLFSIFTFILTTLTFAQNNAVHPCHQVEKTAEKLLEMTYQERLEYENSIEDLNNFTQQFIIENPNLLVQNNNRGVISYTIPVVFHIIHAGGVENISDEQVYNAVEIMNRDYQLQNTDANNVNAAFLGIVADVEIEFKLAKRDNNGNCTKGITRTFSTSTFGGSENQRISAVQNSHGNWPGNKYLNIYVAADIGGAAGYTYLPSGWSGTGMDNGIHVLHNYTGSIGTSSSSTSRTLTHEVGHWLNLSHLWGGTNEPAVQSNCNDDDGVADTPNTIGWQSCNLNGTSCNSLDNVENYMEYSYCSKMFTNGQKARMHAALNSSSGGRNNVVSANNLVATGVNEPAVICSAEFEASQTQICMGQSIDFTDWSFHGPVSWNWTFPGSVEGTSIDQNPTITYNTPGTYSVTLEVSDGSNSVSQTKNSYITVLPESSQVPLLETFESISSLPSDDWLVDNAGNNAAFQITSTASFTGSKSVRLTNYGQPAGTLDDLISGPYDLSSITDGMTMTFRYAYRKRNTANEEWLRIFVSNDCGANWVQRRTIKGSSLSTLTASSSWTPSSQDDWTTVHVTNITSTFWVDNARFKFQFESDGGNNFFIDDINVYAGGPQDNVGLEEFSAISNFNVYPNPSNGIVNISFNSSASSNYSIELINMLGQVVDQSKIKSSPGNNLVIIGNDEIRNGVYLIKLKSSDDQIIRQVIIK
jgi:PKD repeat protein